MKRKKYFFIVAVVIVFALVTAGCSKMSSLKENFNEGTDNKGLSSPTVVIETPNKEASAENGETKIISLFFTDETGKNLVLEEREISKVTGIARATMEELIKGPHQATLKPTLPVNTQLLDINIRPDGLAIVDFSSDLVEGLPASATDEELAVYSIVNTLTQFPTVNRVELRIEGKRVDTLLGHVNIEDELIRNTSLIK